MWQPSIASSKEEMSIINSFYSLVSNHLNFIFVLLFYLSLIIIIYHYRHKFQIYAKIIAMYRTHFGLKTMSWIARKFPRLVRFLGYVGVFIGFIGIVYISFVLIDGFFALLLNPEAQSVIAPVIPGVRIPGSPMFVPFWYGIIGIFTVAAIHEFSHGVVSTAHGVKVKNTGVVFFGPIIGAFVEPDEAEIKRLPFAKQLSIFSAGPFSNVVTGVLVFLLLIFLMIPLASNMVELEGIYIQNVEAGYPAQLAGIDSGVIINSINGVSVSNMSEFNSQFKGFAIGQAISLSDGNKEYLVTPVANPNNETQPYIGISYSQQANIKTGITRYLGNYLPWSIFYLVDMLKWIFILSVGIGLANLLPLGPADGGRIVQLTFAKLFPKKSYRIWHIVTSICIFLLLFNLLFPYIRYIF
jgi:membrane-associated protease RseP (regulator of RpoE activity)